MKKIEFMSFRKSILYILLIFPFFAYSQNDIQLWVRDANGIFHPDNQNINLSDIFGSFNSYVLSDTCLSVQSVFYTGKTENKAVLHWKLGDTTTITYLMRYKKKVDSTYTYKVISDTTAQLAGLKECTEYEVGISSVCIQDTSSFKNVVFKTNCKNGINEETEVVKNIIYPNPATNQITIDIPTAFGAVRNLSIWNSLGVQVANFKWENNNTELISLPITNLAPGQYYMRIQSDKKPIVSYFIKL